jgi:hypothetical protein
MECDRMIKTLMYATVLLAAPLLTGQMPAGDPADREANLEAYTQLLRQDLSQRRMAVVTEVLALTPEESGKFWPVYAEYDKARSALSVDALAMVKAFIDAAGVLEEAQAKQLVMQSLDLEARRTALKKSYAEKMTKATSARLTARWLQVETQIELILGLQVSASLPVAEGGVQ